MRTRSLFTREENNLLDYIDVLEQRITKRNRAAREAKRRETELKGTITRLLYLLPHYAADVQRAREIVGEEAWARFLASVERRRNGDLD